MLPTKFTHYVALISNGIIRYDDDYSMDTAIKYFNTKLWNFLDMMLHHVFLSTGGETRIAPQVFLTQSPDFQIEKLDDFEYPLSGVIKEIYNKEITLFDFDVEA